MLFSRKIDSVYNPVYEDIEHYVLIAYKDYREKKYLDYYKIEGHGNARIVINKKEIEFLMKK